MEFIFGQQIQLSSSSIFNDYIVYGISISIAFITNNNVFFLYFIYFKFVFCNHYSKTPPCYYFKTL